MNLQHPDFQILYDGLLYMAKHLLRTQGEFLPIGAIVTQDGELRHVGAKTDEEFPGSHVALQILESGLKEMAVEGTCRSVGVALDSRLKSGDWKDAIWMRLEEISGKSQGLIVPYAKSTIDGFTFSDPTVALDNPRIFFVDNSNHPKQ